jgi:hypothetical protein
MMMLGHCSALDAADAAVLFGRMPFGYAGTSQILGAELLSGHLAR